MARARRERTAVRSARLWPVAALIWAACAGAPEEPVAEAGSGGDRPVAATRAEAVVELEGADGLVAEAVTALPPDLRDGAAVRALDPDGRLVLVRRGSNGLTCLADDPSDDRFQVACYHDSLEAYMARGRELRSEGVTGPDNLERRHQEIDAGTLQMPRDAVAVYTAGGDGSVRDDATGEIDEAKLGRVYSVYVAGATEASTGLSTTPLEAGAPWIMRPGTPSSHVMVVTPRPEARAEGAQDEGSSSE